MARVQGTVKWFSNKKGYGFIEPTSDNAPTKEDIFVHQSSVKSDGFRTLIEGWTVEFDVVNDTDGKLKADNVTAPGGGPCSGPKRPRKKGEGGATPEEATNEEKKPANGGKKNGSRRKGGGGGGNSGGGNNNNKKPQGKPWHDVLKNEVKTALDGKSIRHATGTIDVSIDKARIKLGTRGYVALAHADAILAEGTFTCDENGAVAFTWEHVIKFEGGAWKGSTGDGLITNLSLTDAGIKAVGADETPDSLWGEGKPDPKDTLEKEGFQMRRVVLTPKVRGAAPAGGDGD